MVWIQKRQNKSEIIMQNKKKQVVLCRIALSREREYPGFTGAINYKPEEICWNLFIYL